MLYRKADVHDTDAAEAIYARVHDAQAAGKLNVGWQRGVYPTRKTVEKAVADGEMYVCEKDGKIVAAAVINQKQVDVYADADWRYAAPDSEVWVLHTLAVDPDASGQGIGSGFVRFYEQTAKASGGTVLRMDTNEINARARRLYAHLGFREAAVVPCMFNGIKGVNLVLLEKKP